MEGRDMKTSEIMRMAGLLWGLFCGVIPLIAATGWAQPRAEPKGPVITKYYAVDRGRYGTIWKIYIEAEATETDMGKIAVVVEQPGRGHYPTDFILLDPQHRTHLKGYLQWNTFSSRGAVLKEGEHLVLKASVIDKAGNASSEVTLPFTFVSGVHEEGDLPVPFNQENLPRIGFISIDLISQDSGS
jgi:hypothetical protein